MVLVLMGVAGAGKTTIGRLLAAELGWAFYDADAFHPVENVERMRRGLALSDRDRRAWLEALQALIAERLARGESAVLACSALKAAYRRRLRGTAADVRFVYLRLSPVEADRRLRRRTDHFMPAELLPSQFETLEEPTDAWVVEAEQPPTVIVAQIRRRLGRQPP